MTDDILTPADVEAIRTRVRALLPTLRNDLEDLSRIPSVSLETLEGYDQAHVDASAERVAALLRAEGLDVEIIREGGQPAVIGHIDGPPGAPTVEVRLPDGLRLRVDLEHLGWMTAPP